MKEKAIICDLDGTLCNIDHRIHLLKGEKKHWSLFFERMVRDTVNEWCEKIILNYADGPIIFVTGRPDNFRSQTEYWLNHRIGRTSSLEPGEEWAFPPFEVDPILLMRKEGDYRADEVVKEEIYLDQIKDKYEIEFVIDDRRKVVDMWRKNGLVCLQCADGDY